MGDVVGPNSHLPGDIAPLPKGSKCDLHLDVDAVVRIFGECDSFGSELNDMCQVCLDEMKAAGPEIAQCDWCKTPKVEVTSQRDYEEGMTGPVYQICRPCKDRYKKRQAEEAENDYEGYYILDSDYD